MSFLLKNKLFKHLREIYRKFKIIFDITSQVNNISSVAFMVNNVKVVTIIYFIVELRDVIVKSSYNFRN